LTTWRQVVNTTCMSNTEQAAARTIEGVKAGDMVVWFSPRIEGKVEDVDYSSIKIRWDDGTASIERKADGFIGWGLL
jgi:hypothetical protein